MKQSKKLKLKLSESQLDVGSLIDPKIDLKHKAVNEVERWALDSAYGTVYHNVDKRMSNASSIGNCQIALALSKITTQQFFCGVGKIFPYCHHLQKWDWMCIIPLLYKVPLINFIYIANYLFKVYILHT